jgi:hypothetical protein
MCTFFLVFEAFIGAEYVDALPMCNKHGPAERRSVQSWCILEKWRPVGDYKRSKHSISKRLHFDNCRLDLDYCPGKWQNIEPGRCFEREAQDMDFELTKCCTWGLLRELQAKVFRLKLPNV